MVSVLYYITGFSICAGLLINFTRNDGPSYKPIRTVLWVAFFATLLFGHIFLGPEEGCDTDYDLRGSRSDCS